MSNGRLDKRALKETDVLVIGGGMAGTSAAITAAGRGLRALVIEGGTYLGRELTSAMRLWAEPSVWEDIAGTFGWSSETSVTIAPKLSNRLGVREMERAIVPDQLKLALEDSLLEAGASLLYNAKVLGFRQKDDEGYVVRVGGKFGIREIRAKAIIDATAEGVTLCGGTFGSARLVGERAVCARTLEWSGVELEVLADGNLDGYAEAAGVRVAGLHIGHHEDGHVLAEIAWDSETKRDEAGAWRDEEEIRGRFLGMDVFCRLKAGHPAFAAAKLVGTAHELRLTSVRRLRSAEAAAPEAQAAAEAAAAQAEAAGAASATAALLAGEVPAERFRSAAGIWYAGPAADVGDAAAEALLARPDALARMGRRVAGWAADALAAAHGPAVAANAAGGASGSTAAAVDPGSAAAQAEAAASSAGAELPRTKLHADVLVIGGGTSGASAAIAVAESGSRTVLMEMNAGLGGSGTVGGVDSYWFGRRAGFNLRVSRWTAERHERMGLVWTGKTAEKWNVEAKMFALLDAAVQAGVDVRFRSLLTEMRLEGDRVTGAVFACGDRLVEVEAAVVIDATGDGDAAVMAGAPYVYGSERDSITMWYSKVPQLRPGLFKNNFTSTVDVGDPADYTRAILTARRRFIGHDHSPYIAPRESRHILGDVVLSLGDQLTFREWEDVVNICFSNYDIKGHSCSDWIRMGLLPPNLEVEIPYRALLPRAVEGLIIAGKAISATHDALPAIRMQADLENLGAVCGTAAALCVRKQLTPKQLPVRELQEALVGMAILPSAILDRPPAPSAMTEQELRSWVERLDDSWKLYEYANMGGFEDVHREPIPMAVVCTAGPEVLPLLWAEAIDPASPRRLSAARALAWHGDTSATDVLLEHIEPFLALDELPGRDTSVKYTVAPPDHGAMPELAYLLYTLAMTRDEKAIPVLESGVEKLKPSWEKLTDVKHGLFYYVDSLCHIAERSGDPRCVPALLKLANDSLFRGRMSDVLIQADYFEERAAYLELVIARTLARCGYKDALSTIAMYLDDARKILVRHAHLELSAITGLSFGYDRAAWERWISESGPLQPNPWLPSTHYR